MLKLVMSDSVRTAMPIDYAPPTPRRYRLPAFSVFAFFAFACGLFFVYTIIETFIPRIEMIANDFGTKLPQSTQRMLDVAMFGATPNYIPAVCLAVAAGFIAPLLGRSRRRVKQRQWLILLLTLNAILLVILIVTIVILVDPFLSL